MTMHRWQMFIISPLPDLKSSISLINAAVKAQPSEALTQVSIAIQNAIDGGPQEAKSARVIIQTYLAQTAPTDNALRKNLCSLVPLLNEMSQENKTQTFTLVG